jgi:hypothetical protein
VRLNSGVRAHVDRNEVVVAGGSARIVFHSPHRDESGAVDLYSVRLENHDLTAGLQVDSIPFHEGITSFFQELEVNWRGWQGTKSWRSYAGELELEAVSSLQGHIAFHVVASPRSYQADWKAELMVVIEPGQLQALVGQFAQFFRGEP